ncbi:hypothetical protein [Streptomyces sp. AM8-1-1]|uniref:hypothetical protein n=1 Tax=Streptomyces sp. AM8-1-1 TaxID=3075825 RepID=UPI0028C3824C|nr:hypothetical protein [Streptomyces sp. AM8-1-1]WNO71755.1 hypothetical protein RPQ07_08955 [Streptomyces sp. AM8-1-1]
MSQQVAAGHDHVERPNQESRTINHVIRGAQLGSDNQQRPGSTTWAFFMERVKGIEPAL